MALASISVQSLEYLHVDVTADVDLVAQPVSIALLDANPDASTSWTTAAWVGTSTTNVNGTFTRTARVLIGPTGDIVSTLATLNVWTKVTDTPEDIIRQAGQVKFI